jgi:hypothetical protein
MDVEAEGGNATVLIGSGVAPAGGGVVALEDKGQFCPPADEGMAPPRGMHCKSKHLKNAEQPEEGSFFMHSVSVLSCAPFGKIFGTAKTVSPSGGWRAVAGGMDEALSLCSLRLK